MSCVAVTTVFLLLAALCIQDTTAFTSSDCDYFRVNVDELGWHRVAGIDKKIKIVSSPLTHQKARTVCKHMNGDLFSIYHAQAHKDAMCWLQTLHSGMQAWIGAVRVGSTFKWLVEDGPVIYNWGSGQPDFGQPGEKKDCLEMNWGGMGLYHNDRCDLDKPFICEK